jgi:hypothetical protein
MKESRLLGQPDTWTGDSLHLSSHVPRECPLRDMTEQALQPLQSAAGNSDCPSENSKARRRAGSLFPTRLFSCLRLLGINRAPACKRFASRGKRLVFRLGNTRAASRHPRRGVLARAV